MAIVLKISHLLKKSKRPSGAPRQQPPQRELSITSLVKASITGMRLINTKSKSETLLLQLSLIGIKELLPLGLFGMNQRFAERFPKVVSLLLGCTTLNSEAERS